MKKISIVLSIISLFVLTNCEKVVDVDLPSSEPKLVIDAIFEVFFDETPVTANTIVCLLYTSDAADD